MSFKRIITAVMLMALAAVASPGCRSAHKASLPPPHELALYAPKPGSESNDSSSSYAATSSYSRPTRFSSGRSSPGGCPGGCSH